MSPMGLLEVSSDSGLSSLEDEEVVRRARAGSTQATEFLLGKYRPFVEVKARSYYLSGAEQDDVVQEGMIGLYKAIRDYRDDRQAHFRSFAELCVTRQIISAIKSATRHKHSPLSDYVSLQRPVGEEGEGCLGDLIADQSGVDPERVVIQREFAQCLYGDALCDLSEFEHDVLRGYLDGRSYEVMAGNSGRPVKAVDNALQRAKRKAGRRLAELNFGCYA